MSIMPFNSSGDSDGCDDDDGGDDGGGGDYVDDGSDGDNVVNMDCVGALADRSRCSMVMVVDMHGSQYH